MLKELFNRTFYEFPSFEVALFSLLLSFVLSTVIAVTYQKTYRGVAFSRNLFQTIVLSSTASSMVIMAVGDSLAVGFGIIGAVAIIRFRATLANPRDLIFVFTSLAVGIATGVYGYSIAVAGTLVFCSVAFVLNLSPYGKTTSNSNVLRLTLPAEANLQLINVQLAGFTDEFHLTSIDSVREGKRYEFRIILKETVNQEEVYRRINAVEGVSNVRMERNETPDLI